MWRLGYYRGITWKMLLNGRNRKYIKLEGADDVTWQWTNFCMKDYNDPGWKDATKNLIPHDYVWAIVIDPTYVEKKTILGTLFNRKKSKRIGFF